MKQGYSETEGKCYPLFFACKNDSLDIRIDGREQMKAKGKLGLQGFLSFLFLAAGWYLMQYFCAYVVLSGSMDRRSRRDLLWLWMDGRRNGIRGM
ncbi:MULTISPECIES: hypothetical protein [unclassified Blautia]|uniref:hypothetical protein n=1 Tax=unclassified Blautia TaxID=2648079 RepID=UPI001314167E|nr:MULTISPECIES: hypothetical protein [unclassified Blautia]